MRISRLPAPVLDLAQCLRFFSRLPVPQLPGEENAHARPDFARVLRLTPIAGALIGLIAALALLSAAGAGLGPPVAAVLALTALVAITGAFHEDGLADVADGFGGGRDPAQRLEIMKDSRIGAFGGAALILSLLLRAAALAQIAQSGWLYAAAVLVATAAVSRCFTLLPLRMLPPARSTGLAAQAPAPGRREWQVIALGALLALTLPFAAGAAPGQIAFAVIAAIGGTAGLMRLAQSLIKGQTGDVCGAAQQIAEIAMLLVFAAPPR
jgi:adenosylcobinamide-GDP ribazoletransferase